jgi:DNA-binding transcriptional LysR family regulator
MDIRQLEYFEMVAKLNNITRAAEQLHVSQSTVTLAIQKLESELEILLFDRSQKHLLLTAEGHVFAQKISDILNRLNDVVGEINSYRQLKKGTIKVGVPPMIGSYLFPAILANFKKHYPYLQLSTVEEGSINLRRLLEKGELDIGIVNLYNPSSLLETITISKSQMVACLPLNHPLAKNSILSLTQLKNEDFILFKESAYNRNVILDECKKCNFTPNIILSSDQIETMKGLVAKGVGICFLIKEIAAKGKNFVSIPLIEPLPIEFGLAWKKDKYLSKASQAFIKFITKIL